MTASAPSSSEIYQFSNGIRVRQGDLIPFQLARYMEPGNPNLHEPVEEEWIRRMLGEIGSGELAFLDVGAAIGYYAVLVKRLMPNARVWAVEPLPRHVAAMHETMKLNGLDYKAIAIVQIAVAGQSGRAKFVDYGFGSQLARPGNTQTIEVEVRRLEELLQELGPCDLLKLDIQGSEVEVLEASRAALGRGLLRHVVVGTHGMAAHKAVLQILGDCGFRIRFDDLTPPMQPDGLIVASFGGLARG